MNLYFSVVAFVLVARTYGNALFTNAFVYQNQSSNTSTSNADSKYTNPSTPNSDSNNTDAFELISVSDYINTSKTNSIANYNTSAPYLDSQKHCASVFLDTRNVNFLTNGNMFVPSYNATIHPSKMRIEIENGKRICFHPTEELKKDIFKHCGTFQYNSDEFKQLPNGSIILFKVLLEDDVYEISKEGKLILCSIDYDDIGEEEFINLLPEPMNEANKASMYIGNIGSAISILALLIHIVTFWLVPSLRNLPGYNLASLGVAFLMAYSFSLIGQIPQVLGAFCVICAISQQYFFLVAFFWMNIMAFDVWKTLRMATESLMVSAKSARRRQFWWYSSYAWLVPLCIVSVTVGLDNSKNVLDNIKPFFGRDSFCCRTSVVAYVIFFYLPSFVLLLSNAVFLVLSAFILKNNTMKPTVESEHRQTAKLHLILYVRLARMVGVTWLIGAIDIIFIYSGAEWLQTIGLDTVLGFLFVILHSLQGLYVFWLFTPFKKNSKSQYQNDTGTS